ncbi:MAG TPA: biotin--[acetyl-CoA-carboxylase] ligase [Solirubrobacterales bacterium]|nr:biotin--[acetyl-CoA-carboxylase] ligase [Solirubrobacterales bacterium]
MTQNATQATFGLPRRHFRRTGSTNARARELVEAGAPHGTVVTADEQTAGRGRQGRTWTAPAGKALLYSAILRPLDERHLLLPLAVPLAVCEAAEELNPDVECKVKWPNDIWVEERKLAGILIEAKPQEGWAVIGVGLNLTIPRNDFPSELRDTAISLFGHIDDRRGSPRRCLAKRRPGGLPGAREAGSKSHPPKGGDRHSARRHPTVLAANALNRHLDRWVTAERAEVLAAWRARDALRGREISWDGGSGVADGIEDSGDLVVVCAGGDRVVLGAGEVHLRL